MIPSSPCQRTRASGAASWAVIPGRCLLAISFTMGLGITEGCRGQYHERQTHLPLERVAEVTCPARDCLVIEENSVYCSVDPHELRENAIFATKSKLHISPGTYALSGEDALSMLSIRVETPHVDRTLKPRGKVPYSLHREENDPETRIEPLEWIQVDSAYGDSSVTVDRFFLRTSRWPHTQFRLGNPEDTLWFFEAVRGILLRVFAGGDLFPALAKQTIRFAPCGMHGIVDQPFRFQFADGSMLELTARVVSGSTQIGYFVGRLVRARGHMAGAPVDVRAQEHLALFGSTWSGGEATVPTFAVRTNERGDTCGFILDSSDWDSDLAVNGYVAYEMTCDEGRGRRLPLKSVSYPKFFALP